MRRQPRRFRKAMTSLHVFGVGELVKSARETLELTLMAQAGQISRRDPCGAKVLRPRNAALARDRPPEVTMTTVRVLCANWSSLDQIRGSGTAVFPG